MRKCKWCGREITVFCGMDDFCSTKCHDECWAEECKRSREKSQQREAEERRQREQREAEERRQREQREQHNAEERFERQQCEDDERHQREQRDAEERLKRQQREHEENLARQLREAEERAIAREKERERRADPQRWYGSEWVEHLKIHPEDSGKCNWSSLDGDDICSLLIHQPELAVHCNLEQMSPGCWASLLCERPEFSEACNCWSAISCKDWMILLKRRKDFADVCPPEKWASFSSENIVSILEHWPTLSAHISDWSKIDADGWVKLLSKRHTLVKYCDWSSFDASHKRRLVVEAHSLCEWPCELLDGVMWSTLLSVRPDMATKCDWNKLQGADWGILLEAQPQFADKCNCWQSMDGRSWARLLSVQPQFADKCDWTKLIDRDWKDLLQVRWTFADKCPDLKMLGQQKLFGLLDAHPECMRLVSVVAVQKLKPEDQLSLLVKYPESAHNSALLDCARLNGELFKKFMESCDCHFPAAQWQLILGGYCKYAPHERASIIEVFKRKFSIDDWLELLDGFNHHVTATKDLKYVREFVSAIDPDAFKDSNSGRLISVATHNKVLRERIDWQSFRTAISAYQWEGVSDNERVEFALKVPECSDIVIGSGFNPNELLPLNLYRALDELPEKCQSFNPATYDWSGFDKDPAEWARLVFFYPQYKKYCNPANVDWSLMDQRDDKRFWAWAMTIWPDETIHRFNQWEKIQEDWWPQLVERQPKLAPYRDKYCPAKKSTTVAPQTPQPKEAPLPSKEKDSERETPSEKSEAQKARPEPAPSGRKQGIIKRYWMPSLAVLLILSAFSEGGVASFVIGAGLAAFWWWKKRKA